MTTDSPIPQHASERLYSRTRSAADDSRNARRLCESGSVDGEAARVGLLDLRRAASQHHCPRGGLLGTTMQHAATLRRPRGGEELAASTPSRGTRPWQRRAVRRDHEPRRGDAKRARLPVVLHDLPPARPEPRRKVLTVSCGTRACQCLCFCLLRKVLTVSCELEPATNLSIIRFNLRHSDRR